MDKITIKNLRLRTIIGANDWERDVKQDLILNITLTFDAQKARQSDDLSDTIDYKTLTKSIIKLVEGSNYFLLEKLSDKIIQLIIQDDRIQSAEVQIDKPGALRFADSVSFQQTFNRTSK